MTTNGLLGTNDILPLTLRSCATLNFTNKAAIEKDTLLTVARGAVIDTHFVCENWNSSDTDVAVRYSS